MHLILGGLPRLTAQFLLVDDGNVPVAKLDHAYEEWRVAPEYDGSPHLGQWREDNERQELVRLLVAPPIHVGVD